MTKISYEKPSFKKYGSMKELTLGGVGSGSDYLGRTPNQNESDEQQNDNRTFIGDASFLGDPNEPGIIESNDRPTDDTRLGDPG